MITCRCIHWLKYLICGYVCMWSVIQQNDVCPCMTHKWRKYTNRLQWSSNTSLDPWDDWRYWSLVTSHQKCLSICTASLRSRIWCHFWALIGVAAQQLPPSGTAAQTLTRKCRCCLCRCTGCDSWIRLGKPSLCTAADCKEWLTTAGETKILYFNSMPWNAGSQA